MICKSHSAFAFRLLVIIGFASVQTKAQVESHGIIVDKGCSVGLCIGDTTVCEFAVSYNDDFGDTTQLIEAWDSVDTDGDTVGDVRVPAVGNLEIVAAQGNTTCTIGGSLPCNIGPANSTLSGLPGEPLPGVVVFIQDQYVIQPDDVSPLRDQAHLVYRDLCDNPDTEGCNEIQDEATASASSSVPDCDDQDPCTVDSCDAGVCFNESVCIDPDFCNDDNICTADVCDETADGCCTHEPIPCESRECFDNTGCDPVAGCLYESVCTDPGFCDDGNVCTADSCDDGIGGCCVHDPIPCPERPCFEVVGCDPVAGCLYESVCTDPDFCDDGNVCTADSCDEGVDGCCLNEEIPCAPRECFINSGCDPTTGCQYESVCTIADFCNDNDVCTVDTCDDSLGGCCSYEPVVCEERPCFTLIGCNQATGCEYEPVICDDGDSCTVDTCNPVTGACGFEPRDCNDGNVCTEDRCDPLTGRCVNTVLDPAPAGCTEEPGWNKYNWTAEWTGNESNYISLYSGLPKGAQPFLALDNGPDGPGRPDPEQANRRILRGFVVAWAVDNTGYQVSWNHLTGIATMVLYDHREAWEYEAYAFQTPRISGPGTRVGAVGGRLELNGADYDSAFNQLLLDFFASGASPFSIPAQQSWAMVETDVTLLPLIQDLRQNNIGPVYTKAHFDVWNANEDFLSHTDRCLWCWDQVLLSDIAQPNNFLLSQLQTDKGKARIDGIASPSVCDAPNCCPRWDEKCKQSFEFYNNGLRAPICSEDTPLVGVANKIIAFSGPSASMAYGGVTLTGQGFEAGRIDSDLPSQPEPAVESPEDRVTRGSGIVEPIDEQRLVTTRSTTVQENGVATETQLSCGDGPCTRAGASKKGSLLVFPSVELKFEGVPQADGTMEWRLIQDTFLSITNDYPADVDVHFLFVNGDDPRRAVVGSE